MVVVNTIISENSEKARVKCNIESIYQSAIVRGPADAFSEMVDAKTTFLAIDGVEHRHDKSVLLSPISHGFPLVSLFPAHSQALYSLFTFPPEPFTCP